MGTKPLSCSYGQDDEDDLENDDHVNFDDDFENYLLFSRLEF